MTTVALSARWGRLVSESALAAIFRASLLWRLIAERLEFLALCLIVLLMPFIPVTASAVLILATGLLFLARGRWRGMARLPLLKQLLVFLAVLLVLSVFSVTRRESLQLTVLFGIYMGFYLMCLTELQDERKIYILTIVFLASVALEACFGLYQNFISKPPIDPSWVDSTAFPDILVRVFGTLDNPNILAQYLIPGIVLGLALVFQRSGARGPEKGVSNNHENMQIFNPTSNLQPPTSNLVRLSTRVLFLGGVAVAGASLVYTWSRMGWLALGLAIAVFLLLYNWRLLLLAAAAVFLGVMLRPDLLSSRLTSITNLSQDSSIFYRVQIWQVAAHMIRDFWFSGVGPGSAAFQLVYNRFYAIYGMTAFHVHNLYLEMLVEYGVFGSLIFLWLLLSYFAYSLKRVLARPGAGTAGFTKVAAIAGLASMASYLFMGLTEDCWYSFKLVFLFWFLLSMTISSARLLAREKDTTGAVTRVAGGAED
ncbi:MAG: O-antigen ligase family protein [Thermacetogeniaceae bacterium]